MRYAFVPFVLLVCSSIYAQNKIDASHVTTPVSVVNFPEVQAVEGSVAVTNLPAVQAVTGTVSVSNLPAVQAVGGTVAVSNLPAVQTVGGTVSVGNLPAVQTVGGTVNVGNLPLDVDGAVRVTSAPARPMVWYELISTPVATALAGGVVNVNETLPTIIDTTGYSSVGVFIGDSTSASSSNISFTVLTRWNPDEPFVRPIDLRHGGSGSVPTGGVGNRFIFPVPGGELVVNVALHASDGVDSTIRSLRVYLFP